jgi:hypothetical protein
VPTKTKRIRKPTIDFAECVIVATSCFRGVSIANAGEVSSYFFSAESEQRRTLGVSAIVGITDWTNCRDKL